MKTVTQLNNNNILVKETRTLLELLSKETTFTLRDGVCYVTGTPANMQVSFLIGARLPYAQQMWHTAHFQKTTGSLRWMFQYNGSSIPHDTFFDYIEEKGISCPFPVDRGWKCIATSAAYVSDPDTILYSAPCSVISGVNAFLEGRGYDKLSSKKGNLWLAAMVDSATPNTHKIIDYKISRAYYEEPFSLDYGRDFDLSDANYDCYGGEDEDDNTCEAPLFGSCMSGCPRYLFELYDRVQSIGNLKMIVTENADGERTGRVLVWRDDDGNWYADRLYAQECRNEPTQAVQDAMRAAFDEIGVTRACYQATGDVFDLPVYKNMKIRHGIDIDECDHYPYADTMYFLCDDGYLRCTHPSDANYASRQMRSCGGTADDVRVMVGTCSYREEDCLNIDGTYYPLSDLVEIDGDYYHYEDEDITYINGRHYLKCDRDIMEIDGEYRLVADVEREEREREEREREEREREEHEREEREREEQEQEQLKLELA